MIRTPRRSPAPRHLVAYRKKWTDRYKRIRSDGGSRDWATATAKRILREALYGLAHGKCVFCESALGVTSYFEIEHYTARTVDCEQCFEWTNLLPACRVCNGSKGNQDHGGQLLKPDIEDPEPLFWIHPDTGRLEPHPALDEAGRRRALETIRICNLQRPALCTQRAQMLADVGRWLRRLAAADPDVELLREEWEQFSDPGREYKFVLRHMLRLQGRTELCARDVERFEVTG